jgi:hypothetical protein
MSTDMTSTDMTTTELRRDIASQRQDIGRDLEAIGDRLSPGRVADRSKERVRRRASGWKDRIMGTMEDARGKVTDSMPSGSSMTPDGPPSEMVSERVEGNPLVAGMVAFGIGFIAGSVLPASRKERELAHRVEPQMGQIAQEVADTARSAGEELAPVVQEEAAKVKEEASEAASSVAGTAKSEMSSARDEVRSSNS